MIPESHTLKINSTDRCETLAHAVDDTEKERLLDGIWFPSMTEVFQYLESYTS